METKKVGIWIRVSTQDQARGDSPEIHERRARSYAEAKGWEVVTVYHLEGISGKAIMHQDEAKRMIQDIEDGTINALIFSKLARLARNTKELLEFADMFELHGASMISLQESIDTSSPAGRLFYTIISAMAQWEREETGERLKASIITRRNMGKKTNGLASYGFIIENAQMVINEKEASIRKLMFELFLEHKKCTTVARILNERGYKSRKGKNFSGMAISRLLKNSDAKSIYRSNYRGVPTKQNPSGYKPKGEWVYQPCPRIVSDDVWDEVNGILEYQKSNNKNSRPINQRVNLFTGYLYCNNGHKMTLQSKAISYSCKHCKLRLGKEDIELIFKTRLKTFVNSPEEQKEHLGSANKVLNDKRDEIQATQKSIIETEEKMSQLLDLHLAKKIPTKGFDLRYNPLFEQSEKLIETQSTLEKELQKILFLSKNFEKIAHDSIGLYDTWDSLERTEKRSIIESITNTIIFDGQEITFKLKQMAPPSFNKSTPNGSRSSAIVCL